MSTFSLSTFSSCIDFINSDCGLEGWDNWENELIEELKELGWENDIWVDGCEKESWVVGCEKESVGLVLKESCEGWVGWVLKESCEAAWEKESCVGGCETDVCEKDGCEKDGCEKVGFENEESDVLNTDEEEDEEENEENGNVNWNTGSDFLFNLTSGLIASTETDSLSTFSEGSIVLSFASFSSEGSTVSTDSKGKGWKEYNWKNKFCKLISIGGKALCSL